MNTGINLLDEPIDNAEYWWRRITGPKLVIGKVTDALINKQIVFLKVPSDIPWRHAMRDEIAKRYQRKVERDCFIEQIDMLDDDFNCSEIGRTLLSKYGSGGYRSGMNISVQDYILKNGILKNRVLWVKGLDQKAVEEWISFCEGYHNTNYSDGLFVIEYNVDVTIPKQKNFSCISYEKYVTPGDIRSFNTIILNNEKRDSYPEIWRTYLAELCASVCGTDAELSGNLIENQDLKQIDLPGVLTELADGVFFRRGEDAESKHILSYIRREDIDELNWRIWRAQVRILFPLVEMSRVQFIQENYAELKEALSKYEITQFGTQIIDPEDLEFGTLNYMIKHTCPSGEEYLFTLRNKDERIRVDFLHQVRNKLAHRTLCSNEELDTLMEYIEDLS